MQRNNPCIQEVKISFDPNIANKNKDGMVWTEFILRSIS